jgi:hypothetical protein
VLPGGFRRPFQGLGIDDDRDTRPSVRQRPLLNRGLEPGVGDRSGRVLH